MPVAANLPAGLPSRGGQALQRRAGPPEAGRLI